LNNEAGSVPSIWAEPVQQDGSHIDLTPTEPIGEGHIGMTYVNSAKDASGADLLASGLCHLNSS
jgi:hypothetical protein